jgi:class 3 adenylate cyclase
MTGSEGQVPSGTVTFLFTDVQGSTRLWQDSDVGMRTSLEDHDDIFATAVKASNGYVFSTGGDGFGIAFSSAADATECAVAIHEHSPPTTGPAARPYASASACTRDGPRNAVATTSAPT